MEHREKTFRDFKLYAVTDLRDEREGVLERISLAYRGGADIVQLRSKILPDAALIRLGQKIRAIATKYRKLYFVNDRVDLAQATAADGVHLGQDDMPIAMARRLIRRGGKDLWIGKSTHSITQALAAVKEGADYIGVGPVFSTPTKPHARSVGLRLVAQAASKIRIPWVAIGGIDLENTGQVIASGAKRIAVVRAIFAAKDPEDAARIFKDQLKMNH